MGRKKGQRARTPKKAAPKGVAPESHSAPDELDQIDAGSTPGSPPPPEVTSEAPTLFSQRDPAPDASAPTAPPHDESPPHEERKFAVLGVAKPVEVEVDVGVAAGAADEPRARPGIAIDAPAPAVAALDPSPPPVAVRANIHRRRLPRKRSLLIGCGLFLAGVATGGVVVAGWLADQRPAWWEPIDAANPHTVAVADAVENGAVDLLSQVRPSVERSPGVLTSDPWTVKLTPEDVNAWIAVRMPKWIRNQSDNFRWPSEVAQLQVDFREDDIVLGVRAQSHGVERYLWVTLDPMIDEDGALWLKATWVHVGRLSLPAAWFLPSEATTTTTVTKNIPDDIRALPATGTLLGALNGAGPVAKNPTVRLADGRRVRIVGLEAEGGALFVTCRTEIRR